MARALVTYIDNPRIVQAAVQDAMHRTIGIHTILDMRKAHESAARKTRDPIYSGDAYCAVAASESLAATSKIFVEAIEMERLRSLASGAQA